MWYANPPRLKKKFLNDTVLEAVSIDIAIQSTPSLILAKPWP